MLVRENVWLRMKSIQVIFVADQVTNLREDILIYRLKYSLTSMEEAEGENYLQKAVKALEK